MWHTLLHAQQISLIKTISLWAKNTPSTWLNPHSLCNDYFNSSCNTSNYILATCICNSSSLSWNPKLDHHLRWNTSPQTKHLLSFFNISPKQNGWYVCLQEMMYCHKSYIHPYKTDTTSTQWQGLKPHL